MNALRNILFLFLLTACSTREAGTSHSFRQYMENGVTIAETVGRPRYERELFQYELLFELEQDESLDETILGNAEYCVLDHDDRIYVVDLINMRIAVFGPDGYFINSIGRRGSGPGEFQFIRLLSVTGDTLLVTDSILGRTSLLLRDGSFISSFRYPQSRTVISTIRFATFEAYTRPSGGWIIRQQGFPPPGAGFFGSIYRIAVIAAEGETIADVVSSGPHSTGPFVDVPEVSYYPGKGILRTNGMEGTVAWFDLNGRLTRIIRIRSDRRRVTTSDRQAVVELEKARIGATDNPAFREAIQNRLDSFGFPEYWDYWSEFQIDEYDYCWAQRPREQFESLPWESSFRVLSPEGEYLGDTQIPDPSSDSGKVFSSHGKLVYSYRDKETGAPVVAVYKIQSAISGFKYP